MGGNAGLIELFASCLLPVVTSTVTVNGTVMRGFTYQAFYSVKWYICVIPNIIV